MVQYVSLPKGNSWTGSKDSLSRSDVLMAKEKIFGTNCE